MSNSIPLKVFLCHSSSDKPAVRKEYKFLVERGVDAWLDEEKLIPGQNWDYEIKKALDASDMIVIFLTKASVEKEGYVQREVKIALNEAMEKPDGTIFIIPAKLEECELPRSLSKYHAVDLFREGGREKLMQAIQLRADNLGKKESIKKLEDKPKKPKKEHSSSQKDSSNINISIGGNVSGSNIVVGNGNVVNNDDDE